MKIRIEIYKVLMIFIGFFMFIECERRESEFNRIYCDEVIWSPDGEWIGYTIGEGLWIVRPDGTGRRKILDFGRSFDFSPDGRWLAFVDGAQIWKIRLNDDMTPDYSSLTQLTFEGRNFFPDWSPDGKEIVYDSNVDGPGYSLWMMDSSGNNKKMLFGGRAADWSPDGGKLVYEGSPGTTGAEKQIWISDTSGTNSFPLIVVGVTNREPVWSPEGKRIAFYSSHCNLARSFKNGIFFINPDGSGLEEIVPGGRRVAWSPDGKKIAFTFDLWFDYLPEGAHTNLWILDLETGEYKEVWEDE